MKIEKISSEIGVDEIEFPRNAMQLGTKRWLIRRGAVLLFALLMLGGSSVPAGLARYRSFSLAAAGQEWDIVGWEARAIWEKLNAVIEQPADELSPAVAAERVGEYLARAARMGEIERELARRASAGLGEPNMPTDAELLLELGDARAQQAAVRPQIEQIIERQVSSELGVEGFVGVGEFVWPPVSFTFVEPPKKFVVSRPETN